MFAYIYRVIQALIYGIVGKMFGAMFRVPLTYVQALQISIMATTPAIVLSSIIDLTRVTVAHDLLLYFLITVFYIFYGVRAQSK